jgi:hypothetical protein
MAIPLQIPILKKARFRRSKTMKQNEPEENPVGLMFFHAYCIGAIEKYCANHGEDLRLDPEEYD